MPAIRFKGVDYTTPTVYVQSDASATDLENTKVPTGQTIKSYLNSNIITITGTGTYISTFLFKYVKVGRIVIWGLAFVPNTNISNSTGNTTITNAYAPNMTSVSPAYAPNDEFKNRVVHIYEINGNVVFRALGQYTKDVYYEASGCYFIAL